MADVNTQPSRQPLGIQVLAQNGRRVLALRGALDRDTAPEFERAVGRMCAESPYALLLDLRALHVLDPAGLCAMLSAKALCEEHGCRLLLIHAEPEVERLFELTEAEPVFPFIASHDPRMSAS
jgi:anti-sigma B factor antagonist